MLSIIKLNTLIQCKGSKLVSQGFFVSFLYPWMDIFLVLVLCLTTAMLQHPTQLNLDSILTLTQTTTNYTQTIPRRQTQISTSVVCCPVSPPFPHSHFDNIFSQGFSKGLLTAWRNPCQRQSLEAWSGSTNPALEVRMLKCKAVTSQDGSQPSHPPIHMQTNSQLKRSGMLNKVCCLFVRWRW